MELLTIIVLSSNYNHKHNTKHFSLSDKLIFLNDVFKVTKRDFLFLCFQGTSSTARERETQISWYVK